MGHGRMAHQPWGLFEMVPAPEICLDIFDEAEQEWLDADRAVTMSLTPT